MVLFVVGPIWTRPQAALSGHPVILSCDHDPVEPVTWTFQHLPNFTVHDVSNSERVGIDALYLIIYRVKPADSGTYNCTDAAGELHAIHLNVLGKLYKMFFCVNINNGLISRIL